ncbi:hypothetical protein G6F31_019021 [Rhizopus arrhizus]|nr:hypothetical protein G6F31_019021 [Rhizopus arrhizus]
MNSSPPSRASAVAEAVAVVVVDALEIVQVQEQDAAPPFLAGRQRRLQARRDGVAVGQVGQHVGIGQHAQALLRLAFFGDVGARADQVHALFAAAAGDELIAEQEQPGALDCIDQPFGLVGLPAFVEFRDIAARRHGFFARHEHLEHAAADDVLVARGRSGPR